MLVLLVVLALGAGTWWWWQGRRTTYETALASLPAETLRASYTDWSAVAEKVRTDDLADFVEQAYDEDLSRLSALESNGVALDEHFGLDLRDAEWEAYGQSSEGSVAVLAPGDDADLEELADTLASLGYEEPGGGAQAWAVSDGTLAGIDPTLTPVLLNVVVLEDERLLVFSDSAEYAESAAAVTGGEGESLLPGVDDLAARGDDPVSAVLWAADYACEDLSMSSADESDQARARSLVEEAGGVSPLDGLLMAKDSAGDVRVALRFESDDQASDNLQPRTDLAAGEAPGLGGTFPERFTIRSGTSDGRLVVLELEAVPDAPPLLSSISDGPVLFATC